MSKALASIPTSKRRHPLTIRSSLFLKRLSTVAMQHGDVVIQSSMGRRWLDFRKKVLRIVASRLFSNVGLAITVANIVVLAMDYHDIDSSTQNTFEAVNFVFMLYFGVESMLKIIGLGLRRFWTDKFNRFDLLTFVMGVIEAATNPPALFDGNPGGHGFFTALRAARAFKLARKWKSLNQLLSAIVNSMGEILNFMLFLLLFMLIFSLVGMELFATRYQFSPDNFSMPFNNTDPQTWLHRSNFDSIVWAAFTVFQFLTYDNFPAVMYDGWIAVGASSPVYASLVIIMGVFIVMNMFSAILVQSVMDGNEDSGSSAVESFQMDELDDDENGPVDPKSPDHEGKSESSAGFGQLRSKHLRAAHRATRMLMRLNESANPEDPTMGTAQDAPHRDANGRSLMIFSHTNPIRRLCVFLLNRREYTWVMSTIIFV
ncbi:hypothetical protein DYB32_010898, partial [Aphanomyces invadans]